MIIYEFNLMEWSFVENFNVADCGVFGIFGLIRIWHFFPLKLIPFSKSSTVFWNLKVLKFSCKFNGFLEFKICKIFKTILTIFS